LNDQNKHDNTKCPSDHHCAKIDLVSKQENVCVLSKFCNKTIKWESQLDPNSLFKVECPDKTNRKESKDIDDYRTKEDCDLVKTECGSDTCTGRNKLNKDGDCERCPDYTRVSEDRKRCEPVTCSFNKSGFVKKDGSC